MKRIVFVIEQLHGGGAERVTAALANELCKSPQNQVHIVSYTCDETKDYAVDGRVARHQKPASAGGRVSAVVSRVIYLKRKIRELDPYCVVSLATPRTVTLLSLAMLGSKIPLILSERNDPERFPQERLLKIARYISYAVCNGVVFQTRQAQNYFPRFVQKRSTIICNPLTGNIPARFSGERDPKIVNYCRLNPQKNLDLLIESFENVTKEFPQYTLEIYGDGPERNRLQKKIEELGLTRKVKLHGYSENIFDQVRRASLFVSSSDYEGISNSMLEAMAIGLPTICTDCPAGGAREIIEDGVNGILVPVRNKKELVDAMRRVLSDERLAQRLGEAGEQLRFDLSAATIARQWMDYIDNVVGRSC